MNKEIIRKYLQKVLNDNDIYGTVQIYQIDNLNFKVNILFDYEEYYKLVLLSECEITDKMNIEIDFTIRDE